MRGRRLPVIWVTVLLGVGCSSSPAARGPSGHAGVVVEHAGFANGARSLPTTIWRPAGKGPFPLVVFGHGRGSRPQGYDALLRRWADAGFEVAGPLYPFRPAPNADYDLVAHDLHAVIEAMVARPEVDAARVAVAGQSLGAIHAMAVARNSCCRDEHVRAALIFAGTAREFADGTWLNQAPPTLFMHGDADKTVLYANGRAAYRFWPAPKFFVTLLGAGHTAPFGNPLAGAIDQLVARTTTDFLKWQLQHDEAAHDDFEEAMAESKVATLDEQIRG